MDTDETEAAKCNFEHKCVTGFTCRSRRGGTSSRVELRPKSISESFRSFYDLSRLFADN